MRKADTGVRNRCDRAPATTYSVQLHMPSYCRVLNKSYPCNHRDLALWFLGTGAFFIGVVGIAEDENVCEIAVKLGY